MTRKHLYLSPDSGEGTVVEDKPLEADKQTTVGEHIEKDKPVELSERSDKKVTFTDDIDFDTGDPLPQEVVKEIAKPADKPTTESKLDKGLAEVKPVDTSKLGEPIATPKNDKRDYTGFTEPEKAILKKLPNDAFDFAAKTLKEKKELEQYRDNTYVKNPNAYRLDPQWTKLEEDYSYANKEAEHWKSQLLNIKAGRKWTPLKGWDAKGNPVFDTEQAPTDLAEEDVRQRMMQTSGIMNQLNNQASQFQSNYTNRVNNDSAQIEKLCAQKFSWVADPKLAENTVDCGEGIGMKSIKQIESDFLRFLPPYYRNDVLAKVSCRMFAAMQILNAEIRGLKSVNKVEDIIESEKQKVEPTSGRKPGSEQAKKGKMVFTDLPPELQ